MAVSHHIDAESSNTSSRAAQKYADLDLNFKRVSSSKDVYVVTDVTAVKRSVRNLILTNHFEKPFHPEIGSGVRDLLFENMTPITANILATAVEDVIENYEPRARLVGVRAFPNLDQNAYEITVEFFVVNAPTEVVVLDVMLEVLR